MPLKIMQSVLIGGDPSCHLVVGADEYVSPTHARIDRMENGVYMLMDMGSTNGTYVLRADATNGVIKVRFGTRVRLRSGDIIRIGQTQIPWDDGGKSEQ